MNWGKHAIRDDHSFYLPSVSFLGEDVLLFLWDVCRSQHFITRVQTRVHNSTFATCPRVRVAPRGRAGRPRSGTSPRELFGNVNELVGVGDRLRSGLTLSQLSYKSIA
jgi:hypothetical protein